MQNKKIFLDNLHYNKKLDNQGGNLEICYTYEKDGVKKFSQWKKYLDCDDQFISKADNRSILPNEVVMDLEEPERVDEVLKEIKKDFKYYSAYKTGSKGYHIHIWFNGILTPEEKTIIIRKYKCDEQKATKRCLIALENCPHWKTGNLKEIIEENQGINDCYQIKEEIKEGKKREKLKSFLEEDRKKFESLGCGCLNDTYYFGTRLFKDGRGFDAIVTSDKNLYVDNRVKFGKELIGENEIKSKFELNYKNEFYDESLDGIFSNKAINKWIFEDCSDITLKEVYEELVSVYRKYIYLDDERKYSILACYRIAGFFMPIWKARARLFLYAEMGSAKSRLTQIMHNTGFNSVSLGDWTLAYLKAIIESTRGETNIDDFETLPEELKNATIRLVKVGYMKGFKAGKMSDGVKRKPEVNDLFNTTSINNTEGLDFISYDRCITVRIPKISKKEYDKEPNFEDPFWAELRDKLYILGLKYPKKVKETYETIKSDKIRGRLFSIFKPELTIAKMISEKLYSDLEDFWIEETKQRNNISYESNWEFLAYKKIYELLSTHSTNSTLSTTSTSSTSDYYKNRCKANDKRKRLNSK